MMHGTTRQSVLPGITHFLAVFISPRLLTAAADVDATPYFPILTRIEALIPVNG